MALSTKALQAALNHLLSAEPWARQQLVPHAGKLLAMQLAPLPQGWLVIEASGMLAEVVPGESEAALTITIAAGDALRSLADRTALERAMHFSGDAQLEQSVRTLVRALRWDVEEDLSNWVGDVAAHRIASSGRRARTWYREGLTRTGQNLGEYLSEERRVAVSRVQLTAFVDDIDACERRLEALEQRVRTLEQKLLGPV